MTVAHRPADERDRYFIADSWCASYRDSDSAGCIQADDWYRFMIPTINKIRTRPGVETLIAYETDDVERTADIYGYIVFDPSESDPPALVYYLFVKDAHRKSGIARGLFAAAGIDPALPFFYVCKTAMCSILQRKIPMAVHHPRLGRFPKSERKSERRKAIR